MPDVLCLGEAMVEYNQTGADGGRTYLQGFGGDTSNVAIAAARQGARAAVAGAVGDDRHGRLLLDLWDTEGVDRSAVRVDADAPTGVYVVTHGNAGHDFHFLRRGSAASRVGAADLPLDAIRAARVLHLSGISLAISDAAREAGFAAIDAARAAGATVAFDTNLRLRLWPVERARPAIEAAIARSDVCLPSLDDLVALLGEDDPDRLVDRCLGLGATTVALKLGARGTLVADARERHRIAPFPCRPVDATGAGDAFDGAFLARRLAGDALLDAARYAAAAAALSTEGYGAVDPIPRADAVRAALSRGSSASVAAPSSPSPPPSPSPSSPRPSGP